MFYFYVYPLSFGQEFQSAMKAAAATRIQKIFQLKGLFMVIKVSCETWESRMGNGEWRIVSGSWVMGKKSNPTLLRVQVGTKETKDSDWSLEMDDRSQSQVSIRQKHTACSTGAGSWRLRTLSLADTAHRNIPLGRCWWRRAAPTGQRRQSCRA